MKPLVSICIPNYNYSKYLDDCIQSALNQTYNNIEIILVDDGSTDNSLEIANKYKDKIKIYFNKKNNGQPKTTNECIELSNGKYLVILHSDDLLLPDMVEKLVPILEGYKNVGMAVGERLLTDENNNINEIAPFYNTNCIIPGIKQARIFMMTSYLTCQVLVRREIIDKIGGIDERHISNLDGLLWFKCMLVSDMAYIQDKVCVYRIHPDQTTAKYNRTIGHMMEYYITLMEMFRLAKGNKYLEDFFDTATKRTAELTLRYRQDVLKEGNYDLAKRYSILATVFNPDVKDTKKPKLRDFSYPPPEGSFKIVLQVFFDLIKDKKIIIYGAGKIGKCVYRSLIQFGFVGIEFWDDKIPGMEPRFIPEEERKNYVIIVTIFAENITKEISDDLRNLGYKTVYERETINKLIYKACKTLVVKRVFEFNLNTCHICPVKCDIYINKVTNLAKVEDPNFIIHNMGALISNKCNLSCQGCNHMRYLYESKDNIDLTPEEIIEDLTKIIETVDLICKLVIVGGEPFLHPKFYKILTDILELPKIGIIHIITNGTVIPSPEIMKLLSNKRIVVEISDYGHNLSKKLQNNVRKFTIELQRNFVNYLFMNNLQWYNFGEFYRRTYSKEKHHQVYKTCCFVANDLFKGKLYKCSRSTFGTLLKKIPDYPEDYVDIRKVPKDRLRFKLLKFLKNESPEVCYHCDGTSIKMETGAQN